MEDSSESFGNTCIQFFVNVAKGVAIDVAKDYFRLSGWRYTPNVLSYQNHCFLQLQLNMCIRSASYVG